MKEEEIVTMNRMEDVRDKARILRRQYLKYKDAEMLLKQMKALV